jgi:hypothetical protein
MMAGVFDLELTDNHARASTDDYSDMEDDDEYVDVADVIFKYPLTFYKFS